MLHIKAGVKGVAPHAGAWIEMLYGWCVTMFWKVAPHAGAWIEICNTGLYQTPRQVAPHAGGVD